MQIFFTLFISIILCQTTAQAMPTQPLILAVKSNSMHFLGQLLRGGANINASDALGRTAAHYAVAQNNIDALQVLLDEGAEVNLTDNKGEALLDLWQIHKNEDMLILLQNAGKAPPAATKLLEIRSLPEVRRPANPLLQKANRLLQRATPETGGLPVFLWKMGSFSLASLFALSLIIDETTAPYVLPTAAVGASAMGTAFAVQLVGVWRANKTKKLYERGRERRVYYTELRDGKPTLHFGKVTGSELSAGMLVVESTDGGNSKSNQVYFKDIGGISIPDHQDLGKQVRLLTEADSDDNYLYNLGEVVEVYDNGHYEIEVDRKFSYESVISSIDKPYRVFVHASLSENKGGFVFTNNEAASGHVASQEDAHIISAAREVDRTQDKVELEQGQVE